MCKCNATGCDEPVAFFMAMGKPAMLLTIGSIILACLIAGNVYDHGIDGASIGVLAALAVVGADKSVAWLRLGRHHPSL